jgi:hypothetical protein
MPRESRYDNRFGLMDALVDTQQRKLLLQPPGLDSVLLGSAEAVHLAVRHPRTLRRVAGLPTGIQ